MSVNGGAPIPTKRVYLGRLPQGCTKRDVEEMFADFKILDTRIMGGFGFLEFENERDVEDAVRDFNNKPLMGSEIIVEPAKESQRRAERFDGPRPPPRSGPVPGRGVRVILKGLSPEVSWQDLKDFGREGGPVTFADVDRNRSGEGTIEYPSMADARDAVDRLNTLEIKGSRPTATIDDGSAPAPRYDDRGGGGYGGGRGGYGGDRYDDRRPRDDYRRDRSPPRRDRYDDRRGGGYDDRRGDTAAAPLRGEYARDRSPPRRREDYPPRRGDDRDGPRGGR